MTAGGWPGTAAGAGRDRRRALVVGLDGMPLDLLRRLAASGVMPAVGQLLEEGACAELLAPVPEISSTSWASFLTGANPGRHGVFGFVDLVPGGYDTYFSNVTHLRAPPLWELAARAGRTTLCLNVPGTYPAPAVRGALVSGFVAPVFERAVSPPRLLEPLRRLGYRLDVEAGDVAGDPRGFVRRVVEALEARCRAFDHLLGSEPWDVAVAVVTETDRLQHFLWRDVEDEASPLHEHVLDVYRRVDGWLARLLRHCDGDDVVALVSDHGFGPARVQAYVNAWLREQGLLAPLDATPDVGALDGRSRAFALDPARLYLHRAGRFPAGRLRAAEAERLAGEVADALRALRLDDLGLAGSGPAVARVHHREEVYEGPLLDRAPDLVAVPAPGVQLRGAWGAQSVAASDVFTGTHTRGNAVFSLRGVSHLTAPVPMEDVIWLVLGAAGIDVPASVPATGQLVASDPSRNQR